MHDKRRETLCATAKAGNNLRIEDTADFAHPEPLVLDCVH